MDTLAGLMQGDWWRPFLLVGMGAALIVFAIKFKDRIAILGDFLLFLKERKLLWMTPIVVDFMALSLLVIITEKSALLAFFYPLF